MELNKSPPPRAKVQSLTDRRLISLLLPAPCSGGRRHFWVGWSWGGKTSGRPLQGQRGNRAWFCSTRVLAAIGALLKLARKIQLRFSAPLLLSAPYETLTFVIRGLDNHLHHHAVICWPLHSGVKLSRLCCFAAVYSCACSVVTLCLQLFIAAQ